MSTVIPMFSNNSALKTIRDGGYGSADFDIDTAELTYLNLVLRLLCIELILAQS